MKETVIVTNSNPLYKTLGKPQTDSPMPVFGHQLGVACPGRHVGCDRWIPTEALSLEMGISRRTREYRWPYNTYAKKCWGPGKPGLSSVNGS